ncbi:hypothetical protein MMC11_002411 [Xylographa trunciseda]|nr:hypothetical protein [Xylographa trunciseda]
MAPITNLVIRASQAAVEATNTNVSIDLPYCFPPFASTAPTSSPLVLWLISAVVIIPLGFIPVSIYLAPNFFGPLTASRRAKNFVPTMVDGKITLPPLEPGSAIDMRSKACLRFFIGFVFAVIVIALAALHALSLAGVMFCSGDNWNSGVWALPWAEWVFVDALFASACVYAVFLQAKDWIKCNNVLRNAKRGKERASDEESQNHVSIPMKTPSKKMKSLTRVSNGLPPRGIPMTGLPPRRIPMRRLPAAHFSVLESIEEETDNAPSHCRNSGQTDNGEGSSSSGASSARGSRSSGGSDCYASKKEVTKAEPRDLPRIMITRYDSEDSPTSKHSSFSSAGIPIEDLDPPLGTYLPKVPTKNPKREMVSTASTSADEGKVLPC